MALGCKQEISFLGIFIFYTRFKLTESLLKKNKNIVFLNDIKTFFINVMSIHMLTLKLIPFKGLYVVWFVLSWRDRDF